jgi:hypothetical protein
MKGIENGFSGFLVRTTILFLQKEGSGIRNTFHPADKIHLIFLNPLHP